MRFTRNPVLVQKSSIQPGWFVRWRGEAYRIVAADLRTVLLEQVNTLEQRSVPIGELLVPDQEPPLFGPSLTELSIGDPPPNPSPPRVLLPAALLKKAQQMSRCVEAIESNLTQAQTLWMTCNSDPFPATHTLRTLCAQQGISLATYYNYRRRYHSFQGDHERMASSLHRSSFNQTRLSPAQEHFADTVILRYYAKRPAMRDQSLVETARSILRDRTGGLWIDPERCGRHIPEALVDQLFDTQHVPMQAILDNPESRAYLAPMNMPSRSWLYQRLKWMLDQPDEGKAYFIRRYGKERWEQERLVFDTYVRRAARPLECVFADFYLLDVFILDEATRSIPKRLWLTVLIDAYSRSILGIALLYEYPCIESIQGALFHAIWPKRELERFGVQGEWPCFGIPLELSLDNAWANHSYSLESLARGISQGGRYPAITLAFRPPYKARYGALVERFFGRLSATIKERLKGAIQSSHPQAVRNAAMEACLLYEDIYRFILDEVVTYQNTPHSELDGMTPNAKWAEGLGNAPPPVPPLTPGVQRLFWRMHHETRTLTHEGLSFLGLHYWSPELNTAARVQKTGNTILYSIRYDPADISRVAVYNDIHYLCDARAKDLRLPDGTHRSVSLWERRIAQALSRDEQHTARDWLVYLNALDATQHQRIAEKKAAHRRTQQRKSKASVISMKDLHKADTVLRDAVSLNGQQHADLLNHFARPE